MPGDLAGHRFTRPGDPGLNIYEGACGVRSGLGRPCSNPEGGCLHFTNSLEKIMKPVILAAVNVK